MLRTYGRVIVTVLAVTFGGGLALIIAGCTAVAFVVYARFIVEAVFGV